MRIRHAVIPDAPISIRIEKCEPLSALYKGNSDVIFNCPRNDVGGKDADEGGVIGTTCD